jgi:prepilin-type N-terminal cleavage/methylation domain-containing protein
MRLTNGSRRAAIASQRGFNLIEVLAAMTIVAVIAVGLTASTVTTIRSNAISRESMTAATFAQDRIEQLEAMAPAQLGQFKNRQRRGQQPGRALPSSHASGW